MKQAYLITFVTAQICVTISIVLNREYIPFELIAFFAFIQALQIALAYSMSKRIGPYEYPLVAKQFPIDFRKLILTIGLQVMFLVLVVFLSKRMDKTILVFLIPIIIVAASIQYFIIRGKRIPSFFIEGHHLFMNELFLREYNLHELKSIKFNGFNEVYTAEFTLTKRVQLKQEYFDEKELKLFLATMCIKSNQDVVLSDNVSKEINAAKSDLVLNNC